MQFPEKDEYSPLFQEYLDLAQSENFFVQFDEATTHTIEVFQEIDPRKLNHRYAEGKWTIKEVLRHLIDTDRSFSYRAMVCLRMDGKTPLYGMDENLYVKNASMEKHPIDNMLEEFRLVRKSFRMLFENCTEEQSRFLGGGIQHKITARALGYISIGHTQHHLRILKERYLNTHP